MAWPEAIGTVLALGPSPAAQALRWSLCGLRATLQTALEDAPSAPGAEELRGLLSELGSLLDRTTAGPVLPSDAYEPEAPTSDEPGALATGVFPPVANAAGSPEIGVPGSSPRLRDLARTMAEDPRLPGGLSGAGSDDAVWNEMQRLLLRVPEAVAGEWRQRALDHAQKCGARPDETRVEVLPLSRDELLYPGLIGAIETNGLASSSQAALDSRVQMAADGSGHVLEGAVRTALWFIEQDPHLCHCLQGVFRFGITPLANGQREPYRNELLRLWERLRSGLAEPGASTSRRWFRDHLREHLDLDEALHSLVYQPLAAPDSWWGRLQGQVRATLFAARDRAVQAGCAVHLQVLGGPFSEINRLAPDSLQVDFGIPGEVAACLRVWARIDGDETKGRVLYRSPREES